MKKIFLAAVMAAFLLPIFNFTVKADGFQDQFQQQFMEQFIAQYEQQLADQIAALEASNDIYETQATEYERSLLERVAMNEAGNQGEMGMRYVVAVILNRVESNSKDFEDTIEGVIFQPNQFSTFTPKYISDECKRAVDEELKCRSDHDILWFSRGWPEYGTRAFQYKDHRFSK